MTPAGHSCVENVFNCEILLDIGGPNSPASEFALLRMSAIAADYNTIQHHSDDVTVNYKVRRYLL